MRTITESIELADPRAAVNVLPEEYVRLLGYPRGLELEDRALELATRAREWYAQHGHPWIYARQAETFAVEMQTRSASTENGSPARA